MTKDNPELEARLALLADETPDFDGDQRRLPGDDPFAAILNLIDETVIAAVLEITDGKTVFLIEVSGRRVCRLPGVIEDLTASDEESLSDAARRIAEFADSAEGPLRVRELASSASGIDPAQSVSIGAIAAAAGRPQIDPNMPPIAQFCARLGDALIAGITLEGDKASETLGDADLCADLEKTLADLIALTREGDGPSLTLYQTGADEMSVQGVAVVGSAALVFSTKDMSPAKIAAQFDQSTGG